MHRHFRKKEGDRERVVRIVGYKKRFLRKKGTFIPVNKHSIETIGLTIIDKSVKRQSSAGAIGLR